MKPFHFKQAPGFCQGGPSDEPGKNFRKEEKKKFQIQRTREPAASKTSEAAIGPADQADEADLGGWDFKREFPGTSDSKLQARFTSGLYLNTDFHGFKGLKGFFKERLPPFSLKIRGNPFNP